MDSKKLNRRDLVQAVGLAGLASATTSNVAAADQAKPKHPIVHFEIGCRDLAGTKDFYQKMFGWPIDENFQIAVKML